MQRGSGWSYKKLTIDTSHCYDNTVSLVFVNLVVLGQGLTTHVGNVSEYHLNNPGARKKTTYNNDSVTGVVLCA